MGENIFGLALNLQVLSLQGQSIYINLFRTVVPESRIIYALSMSGKQLLHFNNISFIV